MKYILSTTLLFSLILISCDMETVIDIDIPPHDPVLVLNGILDTDTNTQLVVSHSVGAFSNTNPSFINNANVMLYKNNQFIDSLYPDTNVICGIALKIKAAINIQKVYLYVDLDKA